MKVVKTYVLLIVLMLQSMLLSAQLYVDSSPNDKDLYGLKNKNGKWAIQPKYRNIEWDEDMKMWKLSTIRYLNNGENAMGAANQFGEIVIPCEYSWICNTDKADYFLVQQTKNKRKGNMGLLYKNRQIIPCEYKLLSFYTYTDDDLIWFETWDGYWGVYDINGKILVPGICDEMVLTMNGFLVTQKNEKQGLYNLSGEKLLNEEYSVIYPTPEYYGENCVGVRRRDIGYGVYCATTKTWVVPCSDEFIHIDYDPNTDTYRVSKKGKNGCCYGLYKNGNEILACEYDLIKPTGGNVLAVHREKWALFGGGRFLTSFEYDDAPEFKDGVAMIKKDGKVQLIYDPLTNKGTVGIAQQGQVKKSGRPQVVSRYPAPHSDVDENIPQGKNVNDKQFVFIVANENYEDAPVPYALNDGRIFYEYCKQAWAVPEQNITLCEDATLGELMSLVRKMKDVARSYEGEASLLFYYAGHGFPDEKNNSAYLLPIDGDGRQIEKTGLSLKHLYEDMAKFPMKNSLVILDACFSGAKREDTMLASSRGVSIRVKEDVPDGNIVVFSASQGDETAHQLEEKGHGLFTYWLLKGLQNASGDITLGDLSDYVTKQVKRQSVVINNKKQTPTIIPSIGLYDSWREIKLE